MLAAVSVCAQIAPSSSQTFATGNLTSSASSCSVANNTAVMLLHLPSNAVGAAFTTSGTYSATVQFAASGDNQATWPVSEGSATSPGTTSVTLNGLTDLCIRVSAYTSGTIVATINVTLNTGPVGPTGPAGSGGTVNSVFPTMIDPTASPYNGKSDAHQVTFNVLTGGSTATITAGNCSSSDIGKSVYGIGAASGNAFSVASGVTVSACTPGTSFTFTGGTGAGNLNGVTGYIGTNNMTAFNTATAAMVVGQVLFLPCGNYLIEGVNTKIFSNGLFTGSPANSPVGVQGQSKKCALIRPNPFGYSTSQVVAANNQLAKFDGFTIDPGAPATISNTGSIAFVTVDTWDNIALGNFNGGAQIACLVMTTDGFPKRLYNDDTYGCDRGLDDRLQYLDIVASNISGTTEGLFLFDGGLHVFGGQFQGKVACTVSDQVSAPVTAYFYGAICASNQNNGTGFLSTTNSLDAFFMGGAVGVNTSGNCGTSFTADAFNVATATKVTVADTLICPNGAGKFAFTVAGTGGVIDGCGNTIVFGTGSTLTNVPATGSFQNCGGEPSLAGRCLLTSAAGPLGCGSSANGKVAVPASTATYTINSTAPLSGSAILVTPTTDNTGIPGAPACGAEVFGDGAVTASVVATSFTFAQTSAAVIKCYNWSIR